MNRTTKIIAAILCAASLGACSGMTTQEKYTGVGAAAGGLIGSAVGGGTLGTLGGAAVGGVIGHEVGKNK